jgi:hypothetical protein
MGIEFRKEKRQVRHVKDLVGSIKCCGLSDTEVLCQLWAPQILLLLQLFFMVLTLTHFLERGFFSYKTAWFRLVVLK